MMKYKKKKKEEKKEEEEEEDGDIRMEVPKPSGRLQQTSLTEVPAPPRVSCLVAP
jgi:hypothetical protein